MKIYGKETFEAERRVALTPHSAIALRKLGYECIVETGAGAAARFSDAAYAEAGVRVVPSAGDLWSEADVVAKVRPPTDAEVALSHPDQIVISFVYPGQSAELLDALKAKDVTSLAMDMVPRISRAQKMDALSSMANIAGYRAVIEAGSNFGRFFTGQFTAAGKVPPAKVLVDRRRRRRPRRDRHRARRSAPSSAPSTSAPRSPSRSSRWAPSSSTSSSRTQDGGRDRRLRQRDRPGVPREELAKFRELAPEVDIVITTALIPGRPAPKLWTRGHGRADEARLGDRRPRRRARRQLRRDRCPTRCQWTSSLTR